MKTLLIPVCLVSSLLGCRRESGEDIYKRIKGKEVYAQDFYIVVPDYRRAVEAAQNNERSLLNEPYTIALRLERVKKHRSEFGLYAAKFDSLLDLIHNWPVRISEGTVFFDSYDNEFVREKIKRSRWATFDDFISNRYPEFRLDTLMMGWTRIHSANLGGDLSVPSYYAVQKSETDSGISIQLLLADTTLERYHVPYLYNFIHISAVKSLLPFESVARSRGIRNEWLDMDEIDREWTTNIDGEEVRSSELSDSLHRMIRFDRTTGRTRHHIEIDTTIMLGAIPFDKTVSIYFYSRQRRVSNYGRGQIIYDIMNSFVPTRAR